MRQKSPPKQLVTSLKKLRFDYVFVITFAADVTIVEEGTELLQRYQNMKLHMIQLVDNAYPEIKPIISAWGCAQVAFRSRTSQKNEET